MNKKIHFIIASHTEKTDWIKNITSLEGYKEILYYDFRKGIFMPNIGREASTYLLYIIASYSMINPQDDFVFCQGDPFDHADFTPRKILSDTYYGERYMCDQFGKPNHDGLDIYQISTELQLPIFLSYHFKAGAQFRISGKEILSRSYDWYVKAFQISITHPKAPWIFERLWGVIYPSLSI